MQRMLVFLVLALLAAVAVLGVMMANLSSTVSDAALTADRDARRGDSRRGGASSESAADRIASLESELSREKSAATRREQTLRKLQLRVSDLGRRLAAGAGTGSGDSNSGGSTGGARIVKSGDIPPGMASTHLRDEDGKFVISEDEMAYHRAVQGEIDRQRRVDGQVRNYGRRIESLVTRGDIAIVPPEKRPDIDKILRRFVTLNDDLVTHYVRSPTEEVRALSTEDRRERLREEREKFGADALAALTPLLGDADAAKVAERVFTNPWGLRQKRFNR